MEVELGFSPEELTARAIRFYSRYGKELEQIAKLLEIKLKQLALAYTIQNKLPQEAILVVTRVKTLESFLRKVEAKNWPQFYYPTDVINDIVGGRVICWFVEDCYGIVDYLKNSSQIEVVNGSIEDYISKPKRSGYRSIHLLANIPYDSIKSLDGKPSVIVDKIVCEVQIRSKLQDAWGDVTHEFHYKAKLHGVENDDMEDFLADISDRLATEDKTIIKFRKVYQRMAESKDAQGKREGFRESNNS